MKTYIDWAKDHYADGTIECYLSTMRTIAHKKKKTIANYRAAVRSAVLYITEQSKNKVELEDNEQKILWVEEESSTEETEAIIVKVIDETTIHDLVAILSLSIDDPNKLSMIKAYVDGRSMQLSTLRVQ